MTRFEITRDSIGEFHWRLRARNGQVIATSDPYGTRASCRKGIDSVRRNAPVADVVDLTVSPAETFPVD